MNLLNFCNAKNCTKSHVQHAYEKGINQGYENYRETCKRETEALDFLKEQLNKMRAEFDEYKSTEFLRMLKEHNFRLVP